MIIIIIISFLFSILVELYLIVFYLAACLVFHLGCRLVLHTLTILWKSRLFTFELTDF